ncbi:MAG: hypothetical protein ABFE01_11945 [Phycisphaerales bacterium]
MKDAEVLAVALNRGPGYNQRAIQVEDDYLRHRFEQLQRGV